MAQKVVNEFQALGIPGTLSTDALKSVVGYELRGASYAGGVASSATVTVVAVPEAGDSISIAGQEFSFSAEDSENDFVINVTGATVNTIATEIGEVLVNQSPLVSASVSNAIITITARVAGVEGNDLLIETESDAFTVVPFAGGSNPVSAENPTIGRAFTYTSTEGVVAMGGAGDFAGILINPHNHAVYDNLDATLALPDGSVGSLAKAGYILVYLSTSSEPGDKVYFATADGKLGAGTASGGQTQIAGAKVTKGGSAGSLVEISLIPQV